MRCNSLVEELLIRCVSFDGQFLGFMHETPPVGPDLLQATGVASALVPGT